MSSGSASEWLGMSCRADKPDIAAHGALDTKKVRTHRTHVGARSELDCRCHRSNAYCFQSTCSTIRMNQCVTQSIRCPCRATVWSACIANAGIARCVRHLSQKNPSGQALDPVISTQTLLFGDKLMYVHDTLLRYRLWCRVHCSHPPIATAGCTGRGDKSFATASGYLCRRPPWKPQANQ